MRDQLIPSPVYTSFIHPLLLFVILTSSSSSSSSSPSLLPPFQRANPIPVGRSVGPRFHHATRLGSRGSFLATPRTPRSLARRTIFQESLCAAAAAEPRSEYGRQPCHSSFIHTRTRCIDDSHRRILYALDCRKRVGPTRCLSDGMTSSSYSSSSRCPILIKLPTMTFRVPL